MKYRHTLFLFLSASPLFSQDTAVLSGTVVDPSNAPVPVAEIRLSNLSRQVLRTATTDEEGLYLFDGLPPGDYRLEVERSGFSRLILERITLRVRDRQNLRLELQLGTVTNSVTVTETMEGLSADSSTSSTVEQDYFRHLPINARNADRLLQTATGIVAEASPDGGVNANGLRSNTNYYTLDGASLDAAAGPAGGGGMPGRGGPGGLAGGGPRQSPTDTLSLDAIAEMSVQTSAFAPEFGRTPGAQISLSSRGGSNQFHGSLFEYLRNDRFNANDWFANRSGLPRGRMRQNQFGGTLGGALLRNRTYFFGSYEGQRFIEPQTAVTAVPDLPTRRTAPRAVQPYMNAFPLPNGPALSNGAAQFSAVFSNSSNSDMASLRLDHIFNPRHSAFLRYSFAPAGGTQRSSLFVAPNSIADSTRRNHSVTAALTSSPKATASNELRINYIASRFVSQSSMDNFGGATPLTDAQVFPAGVTSETGEFSWMVLGMSSLTYAQRSLNQQWQTNVVDSLTMLAGTHQYKLGADLRLVAPTYTRKLYSGAATFNGLTGDQGAFNSGYATAAVITSNVTDVYPLLLNFSGYLQDTWRVSAETTITYGVRWDVNPAPFVRSGARPLALSSAFDGYLTQNEPIYDTRWTDIAPRFGISQQLDNTPGKELIFRGGIGIFNDIGYGTTSAAFNGAPYAAVKTLTSPLFPLNSGNLAAPVLPPTKPYGQISAAERGLQSPKVTQWNASLERHFGRNDLLTVSYVGTRGARLLRTQTTPSYTGDYDLLRLASNGADSDYHGLHVQFRRRLARNLQTQVAYTYAHAIDTASNDAGFSGFASLFGSERGNSDFDVRQTLNFTGSWRTPAPQLPVLKQLLDGWYFDWMANIRTGLSLEVRGLTEGTSDSTTANPMQGLFAQVRPNYNGQPLWLDDPNAPGGQRLNRNAFEAPGDFEQGNLGRNSIPGFGATQIDLSLRRQIRLNERFSFHLSAQAFNVLNHPSFANLTQDEGANLSSSNFGVATRTLGQAFGGGLGSSYRNGSPRSVQFVLRLQF